jgi:hypothetical protein
MKFLAIVALAAAAAVSAVPNYGDGGYGGGGGGYGGDLGAAAGGGYGPPAPSYGAPAGGYGGPPQGGYGGPPAGGYGDNASITTAIKNKIKRLKRKLAKKLLCDNSHQFGQRCSETGHFWFCEPDEKCKKGKWVRMPRVQYLSNLSNMYEPSFAQQYRTLQDY